MTARRARALGVALGTTAIVAAANGSEGAYFSQSWGWVALAFICPVALVLMADAARAPAWPRTVFALGMTALGAWIGLSAVWSISPAASIRELERALVYVSVALALALVARRGDARSLAAGVLAGIVGVSSYALATRLVPDRLETYDDPLLPYRLAEPLGYWNSLGLLTAMGIVIGVGLAAHARRPWVSALPALAMPVLAVTLYFTFSRGAWAALALGLATAVALDQRRLSLLWSGLVVGAPAAVAVGLASRQDALTTEGAARAEAITQGHELASWIALLALLSAGLAIGARTISIRLRPPRWAPRAVGVALVALILALGVGVVARLGGPGDALSELRNRFDAPVAAPDSPHLNERLFSVSGNGRSESIGVAWDAARERPLGGHGAGSYQYLWYESRPSDLVIRDAHSLYFEMLAEVGIVGTALLLVVVLTPLWAAYRARRARVVPAAAGAYVAWAAHSAMDWHWEVAGLTTTAFLAGGVGLVAAERVRPRPLPALVRAAVLALAVAVACVSVVSLVGNQALFAAREAVIRRDWGSADEHGRRARDLLVWSAEPDVVLGDAAARSGRRRQALEAYRAAAAKDARSWSIWLRIGQVARGAERDAAYRRVRELNPRATDVPDEAELGAG